MMNKVLISLAVVSSIFLGYIYYSKMAKKNIPNTSALNIAVKEKIQTQTLIEVNPHHISKHQVTKTIDSAKKDMSSSHKIYHIFREEDIDSVALKIQKIEGVTPISALRMQKGIITNIKVGDILVLPNIDENAYEITVTNRSVSKKGSVSIDGGFEEDGISYSAILTEGKRTTFISMNTPSGTYEIELVNGLGFIYSNSEIENAKIDYHKSDTLSQP